MAWLSFIKGILAWMWNNKNLALYIILIGVIAFLTWRNNGLKQKNEELVIEQGKLPENIEFIGELKGTKFTITYRDSKNNVVHKIYYVPKEGGIKFTKYIDLKKYDANSGFNGQSIQPPVTPTVTNPINNIINTIIGNTDNNNGGQTVVVVNWYGLTFRPGVAAIYDGGFRQQRPLTVGLDAKLFYAARFSAGLGSTMDYPYAWVSRHVDDLIPFFPVENLEIMGGYGRPYEDFGKSVFAIGGRTNF